MAGRVDRRKNQRRKKQREQTDKPDGSGAVVSPPPAGQAPDAAPPQVLSRATRQVVIPRNDKAATLTVETIVKTTTRRSDGTIGSTTDPAAFLGKPCPF